MKRAIVIRPGGYIDPYFISQGPSFTELEQMQRAVGGMIQVVPVNLPNLSFFCNENGIEEELEFNMLASILCSYGFEGQYQLLGNVLVMGGVDEEGETLGLTVEQTQIFLSPRGDVLNEMAGR